MAYGLLSTGFAAKPQSAIEFEMQAKVLSKISTGLNLTETALLGQFIFSTATQLRQLWEAAQAVDASRDPSSAEDDQLDTIGELRGIPRLAAQPSTASMTITLAAGTYLAGSLVVFKTGDSASRFSNDADITTAGGTLTDVPFTATVTGPIVAPAGTLVNIANPISGFSSPTNPDDAIEGTERETNDAYRIRQEAELQEDGSTSVDAIRADLVDPEKVPGVTYVAVYENYTESYDATYNLPMKSVGVVVEGGDDDVVARQIYLSKAGGVQAYGTTTENVTTSSGQTVVIGFTRPTLVPMMISVTATVISSEWSSSAAYQTAAKAALQAAWARYQGVGKDVLYRRYEGALLDDEQGNGVAGTINVDVNIDSVAGGAPVSADYVISYLQRATLDDSNISVSVTFVSAAP